MPAGDTNIDPTTTQPQDPAITTPTTNAVPQTADKWKTLAYSLNQELQTAKGEVTNLQQAQQA